MSRAQRSYTDEQRAAALAAVRMSGGNVCRAAADAGVPETTVRRWLREAPETVAKLADEKAADLATLMYDIAYRGAGLERRALAHFESLTDKEVAAHLPEINRVTGTAIDKCQLLGGGATERVEHVIDLDLSRAD